MAFTYDPADLSTDLAEFRSRLFDTDSSAPWFSDEAAQALIDRWGLQLAMVRGCRQIILRLGKKPSGIRTVAGASFTWSQRVQVYNDLLEELTGEAALAGLVVEDGESSGNVATMDFSDADKRGFVDKTYPHGRPSSRCLDAPQKWHA